MIYKVKIESLLSDADSGTSDRFGVASRVTIAALIEQILGRYELPFLCA